MKTNTKKIKNRFLKTSFLMLISSLIIFLFAMPTYAIDPAEYSINVGQTVKIDGEGSIPQDSIKYKMKALKANAPLPEGTMGGTYYFQIEGDNTKSLSLKFTEPGQYRYIVETDKNNLKGYTFDKKKYELIFTVENTPQGLNTTSLIIKDADGYKYTDVEFKHLYTVPKPEPQPEPEKPTEKIKKKIPKMGVVGGTGYMLWVVTSAILIFVLLARKKKQEEE